MRDDKELLHEEEQDGPQLQVFRGEEDEADDGLPPPDLSRQQRRDWLRNEAFWAGRSPASRISARLVA
jgi:hypothetical protein